MSWTTVLGALFYLRTRSLQNLLLSRVRRLRQPKYLVGAAVGLAYIYFMFIRRLAMHRPPLPGATPGDFSASTLPMMSMLGAAALLVFVALCWVLSRSRASLNFSEAEIAFLFPAPISRRALIHFRLISLGMTVTFTALVLAAASGLWPFVSNSFAMRIVGWWLVFATLSLHVVGSSFAITRWQDRGISPARSRLTALVVIAVVVGVPVAWLWHASGSAGFPAIPDLQHGPVGWLLFPFELMVRPLLASNWQAFALAVMPALLLYAAHYLWVLHVQVSFEEGSIARAEKRAATIAAMRAGNLRLGGGKQKARRAPFDVGRAWRPELAFLWKNLLASAEYLRLRNALVIAAIIVFACKWFAPSPVYDGMRPVLTGAALVIAGYMVLLGPQLARQDFRSDLPNTDILKTYPLHGWQIMLGEMLTPAVVLTVLIWLLLLVGAMCFPAAGVPRLTWLTPSLRWSATLGLALLAPLLCLLQLLILNAAAVLFPAWVQTTAGRAQPGIEVTGQRIFFLAGQMFAMAIMLLPAAIAAAAVFFLARWVVGDNIAAGVAALLALAVLGMEIAAGVWWLGARFERLHLSKELRP